MARRTYRMGKRAESTEETRRRLVEATVQLHAEQGIAETSMKQIAERAGVSVGTAYHHFPTYDDAIIACGTHVTATYVPPGEEIFAEGMDLAERITVLARAMFAFYDRQYGLEDARRAAPRFPILRTFLDQEEAHRQQMAARALAPDVEDDRVGDAFAVLLDIFVLRGLQRTGLDTADAADTIADIVVGWNAHRQEGPPDAPSTREYRDADQGR